MSVAGSGEVTDDDGLSDVEDVRLGGISASAAESGLRQEEKASPRSSFSLFVPLSFLKKLTWLQVISMVLRGGVAAKTTSVLLTKHLRTVRCLRHRRFLHHRVMTRLSQRG